MHSEPDGVKCTNVVAHKDRSVQLPHPRGFPTFLEWFDLEFHSMVLGVAEGELKVVAFRIAEGLHYLSLWNAMGSSELSSESRVQLNPEIVMYFRE